MSPGHDHDDPCPVGTQSRGEPLCPQSRCGIPSDDGLTVTDPCRSHFAGRSLWIGPGWRAGKQRGIEPHGRERHRRRSDGSFGQLRDRTGQHPDVAWPLRARHPQPGLSRLRARHPRLRARDADVPGRRDNALQRHPRLADQSPRLVLHHRGQRLRHLLPAPDRHAARQRAPRGRGCQARLQLFRLVRDALRGRDGHRPDVLRGARAGLSHGDLGAARRALALRRRRQPDPRERGGGSRHGHGRDHLPLGAASLGDVCGRRAGARLLHLQPRPAADDPLGLLSGLRQPRLGSDRPCDRHGRGLRHALRARHLARLRRRAGGGRAQLSLRYPEHRSREGDPDHRDHRRGDHIGAQGARRRGQARLRDQHGARLHPAALRDLHGRGRADLRRFLRHAPRLCR